MHGSPAEPVTLTALRRKLLAADRTSEEKLLGAHGTDAQLEDWAERNGFEIVGWIYENGVPGDTPIILRRKLITAFWQLEDDPQLAGIIFVSIDRQARDSTSFEAMRRTAGELGKHL